MARSIMCLDWNMQNTVKVKLFPKLINRLNVIPNKIQERIL